jgi:hypothetical protein
MITFLTFKFLPIAWNSAEASLAQTEVKNDTFVSYEYCCKSSTRSNDFQNRESLPLKKQTMITASTATEITMWQ